MNQQSLIHKNLEKLFKDWSGEAVVGIINLPVSGSSRYYFRIKGKTKTAIGTVNNDLRENQAFFSFTKCFYQQGLNVPELFKYDENSPYYLIEDLGDDILLNHLLKSGMNAEIKAYYRSALTALLKFQFIGKNNINFKDAYPREEMDAQSFQWDLNYFKYYFLKPKNILFDEQKLEYDFEKFTSLLLEAEHNYFLFRDFQARNIMIRDHTPYFIDYQGGRKGALQYDVASLLFQVKANLSDEIREEFLNHYVSELERNYGVSGKEFMTHFYPYVLIRLIQVMGAYGFRGLIENRTHFIESIPYAIDCLKNLLPEFVFLNQLPELKKCLSLLVESSEEKLSSDTLVIGIKSFAYKAGIPEADSDHGEGFVFDCRALPNPGRLKEYQELSGLDSEVIAYLKKYPELNRYLNQVYNIVDQSIDNYIERGFTNLNVNFGCTGGQHRSVYCTESLKRHLNNKYNVQVNILHTQKENWRK